MTKVGGLQGSGPKAKQGRNGNHAAMGAAKAPGAAKVLGATKVLDPTKALVLHDQGAGGGDAGPGPDPDALTAAGNLVLKQWVVAAVGAALIVLFAGLGVILSLGQSVPTQYWAAASTLTGALVGLLARPSADKLAAKKAEAPQRVKARRAVKQIKQDARAPAQVPAPEAPPTPAVTPAAVNPAGAIVPGGYLPWYDRVLAATDLRVVGLLVIGACSMVGGIWLTLSTSESPPAVASTAAAASSPTSPHDAALVQDGNALIAVGSAAGGAVIGLLSPVTKKPDGT